MSAQRKYDKETRGRAVRMYHDRVAEDDGTTRSAALVEVGELLGVNPATLRGWVRRDKTPGAVVDGEGVEAEVVRLRGENARLKRANEILKAASAFFASAELDRRLGS